MAHEYKNTGLHAFLDAYTKEHGANADIELARRLYWNEYKRKRKKDRKTHPYTINLSATELQVISQAADLHNMSKTRFIRESCIAYITKKYIVPDTGAVNDIKALLLKNYNAVQQFCESREVPEVLLAYLLQQIENLEEQVMSFLEKPKPATSDH